jgi:hypothetical protein
MQRIQRTVGALVFLGFLGSIAGTGTGCAGLGNACGSLLTLALGLGVAVGTYYLTKEIIK